VCLFLAPAAPAHDIPLLAHKGADTLRTSGGSASTRIWSAGTHAFVASATTNSAGLAADAVVNPPSLSVVRAVSAYETLGVVDDVAYAVSPADTPLRSILYRSFDEGVTWTPVATFPSQVWTVTGLASGTLIASTNSPTSGQILWRSGDQGVTWQEVALQDPVSYGSTPTYDNYLPGTPYIYQLLTDHSIADDGHGHVYIGTYNQSPALFGNTNFVFRSTDDGYTFQITNVSTNHRHIHSVEIGPDGKLYLAIGDSGMYDGIFVSSDQGQTLQPVCTGRPDSDRMCVPVGLAFDGFGNMVYNTDAPGQDNAIVQTNIATGQPTTLASVPYEGFTEERLPDGNFLIGNTYEGYGIRDGDTYVHLYALLGSSVYQVYSAPITDSTTTKFLTVSGVYSNGDAAIYESGFGTEFVRLQTTVGVTPPSNTAAPQVTGSPQQTQTLSASTGSWGNSPTGYAYRWQSCDGTGAGCTPIDASGPSYQLHASDVGRTVRVAVTASNDGGSTTATSAATPVVQSVTVSQFGTTSPGGSWSSPGQGYKMGSVVSLAGAGQPLDFRMYARGGAADQRFTPVIYGTDGNGNPTSLLARGSEITVPAGQAAGWFTASLPAVSLPAGQYLLGIMTGPSGTGAAVALAPSGTGFYNLNLYNAPTGSWGTINTEAASWSFYVDYVAAVPVVTGTFGATSPGGSSTTPASGYKFGSPYTLASAANATSFEFYAQGGTSAQSFTPAIYASNGSAPTTLLATGATVTVAAGQAAGWISSTLPTTSLPAGTYYLVLVAGTTSTAASISYTTGAATDGVYNTNTPGTPTTTFGTPATEPRKWSYRVRLG
jgi:hypothetical protein